MKIPLFDIDGTLFKTGTKLHDDAFSYAFKTIYGIDAKKADAGISEGRVDNQIIVQVLKVHGLNEDKIKDKIKLATKAMGKYFEEHKNENKPEILPGVLRLLTKLKKINIPIGLLTGNVESIAWAKIERAGLKNFFDFGAFGNQVYKRIDLVEIAKKNADEKFNKNFSKSDFIIVGDTPKDIECAKDAGIQVIAVSSGIYSFDELKKSGADLIVKSLEEKEKILRFLKD